MSFSLKYFTLFIFSFSLALLPLTVFSQVHISGSLSGVLEASTYLVDDTISVEEGDALTIEPGAIFLFQGYFPFNIFGALYAEGVQGDSIIFVSDIGVDYWGGIFFDSSATTGSVMDYTLISGALSLFGGGITIDGCQVTIANSRIIGNASQITGGGINCTGPSTVRDCGIYYNSSGYQGGGVFCSDGALIENCTIFGNYADIEGGGVYCTNSALVKDCTISYNTCNAYGGGVSCSDFGGVENSTVYNNGSTYGGGIYISGENPVQIYGTEVNYNTGNYGGGIYISPFASAYIFDSKISYSNNHGIYYGAISGGYGSAYISRCIINNNTGFGGGLYLTGPNIQIENCTITGNSGTISDGLITFDADVGLEVRNTIFEGGTKPLIYFQSYTNAIVEHCDFYTEGTANFAGDIPAGVGVLDRVNLNGDSCDSYHNIYLDPEIFATWGSQAFHLRDYSPCIDAGDPAGNPDPDSTIADMGAFYYPHENWVKPEAEGSNPEAFKLYPPCPNPFNATTVTSFKLQVSSKVNLAVYDVLGREVTSLFTGYLSAGYHEVVWDASGVSSGIYLLRLDAGNQRANIKTILIK